MVAIAAASASDGAAMPVNTAAVGVAAVAAVAAVPPPPQAVSSAEAPKPAPSGNSGTPVNSFSAWRREGLTGVWDMRDSVGSMCTGTVTKHTKRYKPTVTGV